MENDEQQLLNEIQFKQQLLMETAPAVIEKAFEIACSHGHIKRSYAITDDFIYDTASFINKIIEGIKVPF